MRISRHQPESLADAPPAQNRPIAGGGAPRRRTACEYLLFVLRPPARLPDCGQWAGELSRRAAAPEMGVLRGFARRAVGHRAGQRRGTTSPSGRGVGGGVCP